ncbi:hypothetical protein [Uliginosibacterium sp. H1]|uniref:hypothetical protein n=1 Tax=Uliginosibacterium sp. H1 TaxID=3114757 RepID=UPI002E199ECF|nr:hypothetical protein [Uliginosibacterium sp. H1]
MSVLLFLARLCQLASCALLASLAAPLHAQELLMLYDERVPLLEQRDGRLTGAMGERLQQVLDALNTPYKLQAVSLARQLAIIERSNQPICALGRVRIADRQGGYFSATVYLARPYVALVRRDAAFAGSTARLRDLAAKPSLRWGMREGYVYSSYIAELLGNARAYKHSFPQEHVAAVGMLLNKQIDFALFHREEAEYALARVPGAARGLRVLRLDDTSETVPRYILCNQRVPDALRMRIDQAIAALPPQPAPASR